MMMSMENVIADKKHWMSCSVWSIYKMTDSMTSMLSMHSINYVNQRKALIT